MHGAASFPLPCAFIDKYMPEANATFVKVYLYGLRHCFAENAELDNKAIAEALGIIESDVRMAWEYWERIGLVKLQKDGSVVFEDLSSPIVPKAKAAVRPQYKTKDLAVAVSENADLALLLEHAENIFGKTFSTSEVAVLYGIYDWLELSPEVILMLLEHCAAMEKYNIRYAEKIAMEWNEKGISNIEDAETYLTETDKRGKITRKFKRTFGITGRQLSDSEYAYILQWTEELKLPTELIKAAYEKTVLATGNASFPYINAILQSWHRQGITKTSDIEKDTQPIKPPKPNGKNNKFTDYEQTGEYDYSEFERRALEKRKKRSVGE